MPVYAFRIAVCGSPDAAAGSRSAWVADTGVGTGVLAPFPQAASSVHAPAASRHVRGARRLPGSAAVTWAEEACPPRRITGAPVMRCCQAGCSHAGAGSAAGRRQAGAATVPAARPERAWPTRLAGPQAGSSPPPAARMAGSRHHRWCGPSRRSRAQDAAGCGQVPGEGSGGPGWLTPGVGAASPIRPSSRRTRRRLAVRRSSPVVSSHSVCKRHLAKRLAAAGTP